MTPLNRRRAGDRGEDLACRFLETRGYRILARNFRTRRGEIDIVACEGEILAFIEVKSRAHDRFGSPEEAVGPAKRRQILHMAREYLGGRETTCRFDVVALSAAPGPSGRWRVRLIRDAFRGDD